MRIHHVIGRLLAPGLVFLGTLGLAAATSNAAEYYLVAKSVSVTLLEGTLDEASIPMWGFALDTVGDCSADPTTNAAACEALDATVPGPALSLGSGDSTLTIHLTNLLEDHPVSIVVPGQALPTNPDGPSGPVMGGGGDPNRVRSFTHEADANGGQATYEWSVGGGNAFRPGSFFYESGTHPQVQVQMGLYGAVARDSAAGEAYAGVSYDAEVSLLFSEIDPALHQAVDDGSYGTTGPTSTLDYQPRYFLVNGQPYDSTSTGCLTPDAGAGDRILVRMANAGLRELVPMLLTSHWDVVAEAGHAYPFAREQYSVLLQPGTTKDAVFTPESEGEYRIVERRLNLTNGAASGGGMQVCLGVGPVSIAVANAGFEIPPLPPAGDYISTVAEWVQVNGSSGTFHPDPVIHITGGASEGFNTSYSNGSTIGQTLGDVLQVGTYTLRVDVGDRLDTALRGYRVRLGVNDGGTFVVLAEDNNSLAPNDGFLTSTVVLPVPAGHPELGQPLHIGLTGVAGTGQVNFDNVRLEYTPSLPTGAPLVANAGFEIPPLPPAGDYISTVFGWDQVSGSSGTFHPDPVIHITGGASEGFNTSYSNGSTIAQTLGGVLQEGTWTLRVDVGDRLDQPFGGYRVQLGVNDGGTFVVLAEDNNSLVPNDGFLTSTVVHEAAAGDPSLGYQLEIRLVGISGVQTNFDNVRLDFAPPAAALAGAQTKKGTKQDQPRRGKRSRRER